jgi:hypothetical protein
MADLSKRNTESSRILGKIKVLGESPRFLRLDRLDQYYFGLQYEGKPDWVECERRKEPYIPIRDRKPLIQVGLCGQLVDRTASAMFGEKYFPKIKVTDDPLTEEFVRAIIAQSKLKAKFIAAAQKGLTAGSVLAVFSIMTGRFRVDFFDSKHCKPEFNKLSGELERVVVLYKYLDEETDEANVWRWYKLELTQTSEILYDNPKVNADGRAPEFQVAQRADHDLGFVTGEWITVGEERTSIDGVSLIDGPVQTLSDSLDYSLSQSDRATSYNMDPQVLLKGIDADEMDALIRSSSKAWSLGRDGEAKLLEMTGKGIEAGRDHRTEIHKRALEASRVIILDPKDIAGQANSGIALERMHAPFVDLVGELRPWFGEYGLVPLLQKMIVAAMITVDRGMTIDFEIPVGYQPLSLNIELDWPPIFPPTPTDLQAIANMINTLAAGQIISRETGTRYMAQFLPIGSVDEELDKIAKQPPPPNPFGAF